MLTDIRVLDAQVHVARETAREPLKFGGVVVDGCLYCHARVTVETRRGRVAQGWGAIFLMDMWGWPSAKVAHADREIALERITEAFARAVAGWKEHAHPLDIFLEVERDLPPICRAVGESLDLREPVPPLAALISASPVDMALHDAFGKANEISSYLGYGRECMARDLSAYLGPPFRGRYISDYLSTAIPAEIPVFHLVGGLDTIHKCEASGPGHDLPATLEDWIERDGLFCFKVKLRGNDLAWDLARFFDVVATVRRLSAAADRRPVFSVDTNEQCNTPEYVVEFLRKVADRDRAAFDALLYVEQPVSRDLRQHPQNVRGISRLKPVILDEGLAGTEDLDLALALGWSGIALKTCKCHSKDLLFACLAEERGIPYTLQDLTNPGLALLHSVGFAARTRPWVGVETNSRQYFPATSTFEAGVHPRIFAVAHGRVATESLTGPGFGFRTDEIRRPIFHGHTRGRADETTPVT